jgi:hypothetical protein
MLKSALLGAQLTPMNGHGYRVSSQSGGVDGTVGSGGAAVNVCVCVYVCGL